MNLVSSPHTTIPMRTLLDLAIERIYRAAVGDLEWREALAAIARAHGADRSMLITPGMTEDGGGLCVSYDASGRSTLRAVRDNNFVARPSPDNSYSILVSDDTADHPNALLVLLPRRFIEGFPTGGREALDVTCRHLSIALRIWYRNRALKDGAEILAANLNAAAMLLDGNARVAWLNARAAEWVREGKIAVVDERLIDVPAFDVDVSRLLGDTLERGSRLELAAQEAQALEAMRIGDSQVLLILRDRAGCRQAAAALAANFSLTSTEVDLAIALWKGMLIGEYAAQRSVAMSTVRTQLKSLLSKTGARRQSDIVSIVARLQPIAGDAAFADLMAVSCRNGRDRNTRRDTSNGR